MWCRKLCSSGRTNKKATLPNAYPFEPLGQTSETSCGAQSINRPPEIFNPPIQKANMTFEKRIIGDCTLYRGDSLGLLRAGFFSSGPPTPESPPARP